MKLFKGMIGLLSVLIFAAVALATDTHEAMEMSSSSVFYAGLELPFILLAVFFCARTAQALRGGVFGSGMLFVSIGMIIMAVGHLHMQIEMLYHVNLFEFILGNSAGKIAWVAALLASWGFSGFGFFKIFAASGR